MKIHILQGGRVYYCSIKDKLTIFSLIKAYDQEKDRVRLNYMYFVLEEYQYFIKKIRFKLETLQIWIM